MAGIAREFVGLPSPVVGRAGAGGHPCQGVYHRPAGTAPKTAFIATHYNVDFDLRMIDPSIEPSDRRPDWCYLGDPVKANYGVFGIGAVSTLRTWLSIKSRTAREDRRRISSPPGQPITGKVSAVQKRQPGEEPAYPIASVNNALLLLKLFGGQPRVRLSEASEHLGIAHSTAHRLMAMLAYHGFVRQEQDSRAYMAGPALVEIGLAAIRQLDIRRHARPVLERLAGSLGETVHLAVLEGANVRYLDAVESSRALRVASRTGSVLAASCTASGKALLAALPDAEVAAIFADGAALPQLTARSITSRSALLAELVSVREAGCAVNREESEEGVASVAVAVRGPRQVPVAALTVSAPVSRMTGETAEKIKGELLAQAAWLEDQLPGAS